MEEEFVRFEVTISDSHSVFVPVERSFSKGISLRDLKMKLELLTGIASEGMKITLFVDDSILNQNIANEDNSRSLGSFLPSCWENRLKLAVEGEKLGSFGGEEDTTDGQVNKFELSDEAYEARSESLRRFKQQQLLGRFNPEVLETKKREEEERIGREIEAASGITIGNRAEVRTPGQPPRRGLVKFVGTTHFKGCIPMVGVQFDEPVGKNDGSVEGHRYFTCPDKYGSFVIPSNIVVGDFPEEDPFAD